MRKRKYKLGPTRKVCNFFVGPSLYPPPHPSLKDIPPRGVFPSRSNCTKVLTPQHRRRGMQRFKLSFLGQGARIPYTGESLKTATNLRFRVLRLLCCCRRRPNQDIGPRPTHWAHGIQRPKCCPGERSRHQLMSALTTLSSARASASVASRQSLHPQCLYASTMRSLIEQRCLSVCVMTRGGVMEASATRLAHQHPVTVSHRALVSIRYRHAIRISHHACSRHTSPVHTLVNNK